MKKALQLILLLPGFVFFSHSASAQCYADLGITATANYQSCVGSQMLITVSLTNSDAGSRTATASVPLPQGLTIVSTHATGGSYNSSTGEWSNIYFAQDQRALMLYLTCTISAAVVGTLTASITNTGGVECETANNSFSLSFATIGTCDNDNDGILDHLDADDDNDGITDEQEYGSYVTPATNLLANGGSQNDATTSLVSVKTGDYANSNSSEVQATFQGDPYHTATAHSSYFLVKRNETNAPVKVWEQTIGGLKDKTSYVLVFYTSNLSNPWTNPGSNPSLTIKQDGQLLETGIQIRDDFETHGGADGWDRHEYQFVPNFGTNAATLSIYNDFSAEVGNQFAMTAFEVIEFSYAGIGGNPLFDTDGDSILNYRDLNFCGLNEKNISQCMDFDGDGIINQFDNDADNDGVSDLVEFGGCDADGDGRTDALYADQNANGMADVYESLTNEVLLDFDGDGLRNGWDLDSDNDGIADAVEAGINAIKTLPDSDNNGLANGYLTGDADHDGLLSTLDLDGDGDGMTDLDETIGSTGDDNGMIEGNKITDSNLNGWSDLVDGSKGSLSGINNQDADGDGLYNFQDADADGDGIADNIEMQESETYTKLTHCLDLDEDGLSNQWDSDTLNKGGNGLFSLNLDRDFAADFLDLDTDNDNTPDWIEAVDQTADGNPEPELQRMARQYLVLGGNPAFYPIGARSSGLAWAEVNVKGIPAFLNPADAWYHDTDGDGLIDLFDEDNAGMSADMADADQNGMPDWREAGQRGAGGFGTLPVTLVSFNAALAGNNSEIVWNTASERNIENYVVERSLDGVTFDYLGSLKAANSQAHTTYNLTDPAVNELFTSVIYYRLRINEGDGSFHYSNMAVVRIQNALGLGFLSVYPVPAVNHLNMQFAAAADTKVQVQLSDMGGRTVLTETRQATKGQNTLQLNTLDHLAAGYYMLSLSGDGVQLLKKIQKN